MLVIIPTTPKYESVINHTKKAYKPKNIKLTKYRITYITQEFFLQKNPYSPPSNTCGI